MTLLIYLSIRLDLPTLIPLTPYLSGIIAYTDTDSHQHLAYLASEQRFTTNMLFRRGYKWPITSDS
ncbi:hypothetical protein, partial [uncultured Acetobacterium sp.]|uniref:hypothetical protein n=1 Tax=uncultured Acetobacterium sp. TaxID=217139 RepID=UPI0025D3FBC1